MTDFKSVFKYVQWSIISCALAKLIISGFLLWGKGGWSYDVTGYLLTGLIILVIFIMSFGDFSDSAKEGLLVTATSLSIGALIISSGYEFNNGKKYVVNVMKELADDLHKLENRFVINVGTCNMKYNDVIDKVGRISEADQPEYNRIIDENDNSITLTINDSKTISNRLIDLFTKLANEYNTLIRSVDISRNLKLILTNHKELIEFYMYDALDITDNDFVKKFYDIPVYLKPVRSNGEDMFVAPFYNINTDYVNNSFVSIKSVRLGNYDDYVHHNYIYYEQNPLTPDVPPNHRSYDNEMKLFIAFSFLDNLIRHIQSSYSSIKKNIKIENLIIKKCDDILNYIKKKIISIINNNILYSYLKFYKIKKSTKTVDPKNINILFDSYKCYVSKSYMENIFYKLIKESIKNLPNDIEKNKAKMIYIFLGTMINAAIDDAERIKNEIINHYSFGKGLRNFISRRNRDVVAPRIGEHLDGDDAVRRADDVGDVAAPLVPRRHDGLGDIDL